MKKLVGLSKSVLNLDGKPLVEVDGSVVTVGSILANSLARGNSQEPARAMAIALKIYKAEGDLEIEDADFALVESTLVADQLINNMAKAATLAVLNGSQGTKKP